VALNEVEPEAWQGVWDAEIKPQMATLIKKPGYSM
jgi:4-oxalocrotonate tautomerase